MPAPVNSTAHLPAAEGFEEVRSLLAREDDPAAFAEALGILGEFPMRVLGVASQQPGLRAEYKDALSSAAHLSGSFANSLNESSVSALCLLGCLAVEVTTPLDHGRDARWRRDAVIKSVGLLQKARQTDRPAPFFMPRV